MNEQDNYSQDQPDFEYLGTPSYPYPDTSLYIAMPNPQQPNYQNIPQQGGNTKPFIGPQKNHRNRNHKAYKDYEQMLKNLFQEIKAAAPMPQAVGIDSVQFNKRQREQFREVWKMVLRDNITPEQAAARLGYDPYNWG
jgi:hypothetical protein